MSFITKCNRFKTELTYNKWTLVMCNCGDEVWFESERGTLINPSTIDQLEIDIVDDYYTHDDFAWQTHKRNRFLNLFNEKHKANISSDNFDLYFNNYLKCYITDYKLWNSVYEKMLKGVPEWLYQVDWTMFGYDGKPKYSGKVVIPAENEDLAEQVFDEYNFEDLLCIEGICSEDDKDGLTKILLDIVSLRYDTRRL